MPETDRSHPIKNFRRKVRNSLVGGTMVVAEAITDFVGSEPVGGYGLRDLEAGIMAIIGRHPAVPGRALTRGERVALVVGAALPETPPTAVLVGYKVIFKRQVDKSLEKRDQKE